jgi:hypothetical protein
MATWKKLIEEAFEDSGDTWADVISNTMSEEQMLVEFYNGFGGTNGIPFTIWTERFVYFPAQYDGAEWVEWVSRNPNGNATYHIGGG